MARHAYASVTLPEEEDIVTLSHWLGHETPTIALEHSPTSCRNPGPRARQP